MGDAVAATHAGGGRGRAHLVRLLTPELAAHGFDLEDVAVTRAGSRSVVRVVVDRDDGIDLDAVAEASRAVSAVLDAVDGDGAPVSGPYVLEVSSPGVDRPLVAARHWRRARGRLVSVHTRDGRQLIGRVRASGPDSAELAVDDQSGSAGAVRRISFADVARAVVQVEFRATGDDSATGEDSGTGDDSGTGADVQGEAER
ncbi:ribosome maturation factor RimP [Frankia sp. Cas4]|uniref:ribosome maturation factor RimP n=1 Tax=Frankia sp. Cas4 TaxID=3073927 RepID=UPI002AD21F5E|nr:ribosome maturation factor RimP [Frankia sp. Cas4]